MTDTDSSTESSVEALRAEHRVRSRHTVDIGAAIVLRLRVLATARYSKINEDAGMIPRTLADRRRELFWSFVLFAFSRNLPRPMPPCPEALT